MLFFDRENTFHHGAGTGVIVPEIANELAIVIHGDALGDEIFFDHLHQIVRAAVFRRRAGRQAVRVEIGLSAELIDALRDLLHVIGLVLGVLREFRFHTLAGNARGSHGMHGVAEHAYDFGGEHGLQNLDGFFHIALIGEGHPAGRDIFSRALAQGLDVGEKRLGILAGVIHCLLLNERHGLTAIYTRRPRIRSKGTSLRAASAERANHCRRCTDNASSSPATSRPNFGGSASKVGMTPCSRSAREHTGPMEAMTKRFSWFASSNARPVFSATAYRL